MKRLALFVAVVPLALLTACGEASDVQGGDTTSSSTPTTAVETSTAPTTSPPTTKRTHTPKPPPPPPTTDIDGTYSHTCDYLLGDFSDNTSHGYRFVADATIHNTGNIGTRDKLVATWYLAGGQKLTKSTIVKVNPGHSIHAGVILPATGDQVSQYQSGPEDCKAIVTIIGTYGPVKDR